MIRKFKFEDLEQVNNLLKYFNLELSKESFNNDFLNLLVYQDKEIDGVLVYRDFKDRLEIDYIIVRENSRNRKIGTSLFQYLEKIHNNINNITLEVRKSNVTAISFYKKNGFIEAAIRKNYYNDEDGILMIKEYR